MGFGYAMNLALNNVFLSQLANSTILLGLGHGSYGVGGTIAPLVATAMVSRGITWSRFFLITLVIRAIALVCAGYANKDFEKEDCYATNLELERMNTQQRADHVEPTSLQLLRQALRNRTTILGALFIFAYQGAEVSISGWVISFLINARHGNSASVGYVTSGFWAGITLGRFVLTHLSSRVGEKLFVIILVVLSIGFQLLVWFVPNITGDAVAVSLIGLMLGPVYSSASTVFAQLLPRRLQVTAIGFIASAGSSGGAIAPLLTGLLAQVAGTFVLHPICIGLFCVMLGCWSLLPKTHKRTE